MTSDRRLAKVQRKLIEALGWPEEKKPATLEGLPAMLDITEDEMYEAVGALPSFELIDYSCRYGTLIAYQVGKRKE